MSNVIGLPGIEVPKNVMSETSVAIEEYLTDLLDRVRKGEVETFAIATLNMDKTATTRIIGTEHGFELLGVIELLKHDLLLGITDGGERV
jgi:hypothetical protein